jgi:hypothetical protein
VNRIILIALVLLMACPSMSHADPVPRRREYCFDMWDWTKPCRDLPTFKIWAADLKKIGVTRIEMSAPWNLLEPADGQFDLSFIADRLAVAKSLGMGLRIRINSYYAGATPTWLKCDSWCDIDGKPPQGTPVPVSINDPRFWAHYGPLCTQIAKRFRGEDMLFNSFIGVHAELKYSDWWTYDESSLRLWKETIHNRPTWLKDVVGDAELPDVPPIPPQTDGTPDTQAVSKAFIAFREETWRDAERKFNAAIHAGDPNAKTSAPLGESFRKQSAQFSNLDYFGMSRGDAEVVHSYDFFWHVHDDPWHAAAAVASFQGITRLPVSFEFDGPALTDSLGYTSDRLLALADAVIAQGGGIKVANYSGSDTLPSTVPHLRGFGEKVAAEPATIDVPPPSKTVLLFVSKWTTYCYREPTEWLNDAQFGGWKMLRDNGWPVRFICEDNLDENLAGYRGIYVAFSPPQLMPEKSQQKLSQLCDRIPSITELSEIPSEPPAKDHSAPQSLQDGKHITLEYPLAFHWLKGDDHDAQQSRFTTVMKQVIGTP